MICKPDSGRRLAAEYHVSFTRRGKPRHRRRLPAGYRRARGHSPHCRYQDIQAAINHARSGYRIQSHVHGLFGAFQRPSAEPLRELVRLGRIVILDPGASAPLFAAWRMSPGYRGWVSIDYRPGRLAFPATMQAAAPSGSAERALQVGGVHAPH